MTDALGFLGRLAGGLPGMSLLFGSADAEPDPLPPWLPMDFPTPARRDGRRGAYTGLTRPRYPKVFRPYGTNQRERLVGKRPTGMHTYGYDKEIVESRPVPAFLPTHAPLGQSGASAVTAHIPAFQPGSGHWLFDAS